MNFASHSISGAGGENAGDGPKVQSEKSETADAVESTATAAAALTASGPPASGASVPSIENSERSVEELDEGNPHSSQRTSSSYRPPSEKMTSSNDIPGKGEDHGTTRDSNSSPTKQSTDKINAEEKVGSSALHYEAGTSSGEDNDVPDAGNARSVSVTNDGDKNHLDHDLEETPLIDQKDANDAMPHIEVADGTSAKSSSIEPEGSNDSQNEASELTETRPPETNTVCSSEKNISDSHSKALHNGKDSITLVETKGDEVLAFDDEEKSKKVEEAALNADKDEQALEKEAEQETSLSQTSNKNDESKMSVCGENEGVTDKTVADQANNNNESTTTSTQQIERMKPHVDDARNESMSDNMEESSLPHEAQEKRKHDFEESFQSKSGERDSVEDSEVTSQNLSDGEHTQSSQYASAQASEDETDGRITPENELDESEGKVNCHVVVQHGDFGKKKIEFSIEPIANLFTCKLCNGIFRDPYTINKQCLHTFCKSCLVLYMDQQKVKKCPECEEYLGKDWTKYALPDRALHHLIDNVLFKEVASKDEDNERSFYEERRIKRKPEKSVESRNNDSENKKTSSTNKKRARTADPTESKIVQIHLIPKAAPSGTKTDALEKPFLEVPEMIRIGQLKKYLVTKVGRNATFMGEVFCNGASLGNEWTIAFVKRTIWIPGEGDGGLETNQILTLQYR